MIEVRDAYKAFIDKKRGRIEALRGLSVSFADGAVHGLLGLNGAGKSTLIRLVQGTQWCDAGEVRVDGKSVAQALPQVRTNIGVLSDDAGLYKRLTARENIEYFAELKGLSAAQARSNSDWFIEKLNMQKIADRLTEGFSQGERMKTCLARALVHKPKNILLDEPLNGLDVFTNRDVKALLRSLATEGHCVVVSSHQMSEIESLLDNLAVIAAGKLQYAGSLSDARARLACQSLEDIFVALVGAAQLSQCVDAQMQPDNTAVNDERLAMVPVDCTRGDAP